MAIHPDITVLRGNPALQRQAQVRVEAALENWRRNSDLPALQCEVTDYATSGHSGALLVALFGADPGPAEALVRGLVCSLAAGLIEQPLGHLGLRHSLDDLAATLVLARSGSAALSIQMLDGLTLTQRPPASTAVFQPSQSIARVLSGSAKARLALASEGPPNVLGLDLESGSVVEIDGEHEALLIDRIDQHVLLLKLQRRTAASGPVREVDLGTGSVVRQAAASPRDSRLELASALLGGMGRADSAPLLAAMAQEAGSPQLRWHALRECLALDSATGFGALDVLAESAADPLAAPAAALRRQLLAAHPELGAALCPA